MREARTWLNLTGALILLAGLGSAAAVYVAAGNEPRGAIGYEGGYPIMPEDSKQYRRSLELYGGKANVLADDLRNWLDGLTHGTGLAWTIACASVVISLSVFYYANYLTPPPR